MPAPETNVVDSALVASLVRVLDPRAEILDAYLFGSRARGRARPDSDIDVAVYIDEKRAENGDWGYRAELTTAIMTALGTNDVDVVVLNRAPPLLYHRVLRDGVRLVSRDPEATTTRAGQALSRYFDFLPWLDRMGEARRRRSCPGGADRRVVDRHIPALRAAVAALRRHAGADAEALRADPDLIRAVERGLQLAAQNAIDAAGHLAAAAGRDPAGYAAAIDELARMGALPPAFAARFRAIASLRDILVHGYLDVDVELVADALAVRLDDFEEFARCVELWIAAPPAQAGGAGSG